MDLDAASMVLKELEKHLNLDLQSDEINEFDTLFLENQIEFFQGEENSEFEEFEEEYDEEFEGYNNPDKSPDDHKSFSSHSKSSLRDFKNNKDDLDKYR